MTADRRLAGASGDECPLGQLPLLSREGWGESALRHEAPVEKATPFSTLRRHETPLMMIAAMGGAYRPRFRASTMLCD
ncbi:hypothetical protein NS337_04970 [Pseudomonas oryzihabitans]|nr:hypothetical protein NS337_04970 [Pseudomonas psychrotolerans]